MNIKKLRLSATSVSRDEARRPPRLGPKKHFLKGPVPLDWLEAAAKLRGAALHVGVYIWYIAGLTKSNQVPVPATKVKQFFGVSRFALYRALDALQTAGLIAVQRHRGRHAVVTLNGCLRASGAHKETVCA